MATTAVVCFALTIGFSGNGNGANDAAAHQVSSLREQIRLAAAKTDALPKATDAARGLVTAQTSADHVASLQNDYRYLTPRATADGALDTDATASIRRNLAPYFAPSAGQDALGPWYLLASDRNVPAGAGIPMSFDSGFTWIAERPYTVTEDGTVRITWLAVETRPAAGRTAQVYAWAQADFDLTRTTFTTAQTGTTALGESLRMAVIRS
ncbi:hypothetical protein [Amycolatopsis sp. CA-230715]|uniref:hypothetical protein n=1 Tax=Amycolatopsis sp. CA-230715 TaxID=2745196 RepID=UPI001C03A206|nr:hypothetical protein [Amycolatopsis sp. CA-230715]